MTLTRQNFCKQRSAIDEINIVMQNICSLYNKLNFVVNFLLHNNTHVLFLTETWLKPEIIDSMINIPNFTLIRSDRLDKKGGGVALYFKSSLNVTLLEKPFCPIEFSNFDYLAIEIFTGKTLVRIL